MAGADGGSREGKSQEGGEAEQKRNVCTQLY